MKRYEEGDPELFALRHAPLHGEPTSYQAAQNAARSAADQCHQLWNALLAWGPLTADEADARLGWRPTTSGRRMADLVDDGRAEATGERRLTRSRRWANVFKATKREIRLVS